MSRLRIFTFILIVAFSMGCTLTQFIAPQPDPTIEVLPPATATNSPTQPPAPPSGIDDVSSIASLQTIEFNGKTFELKFKSTDQPVQIYEFYLPSEGPTDWIELVEIQIYPASNPPILPLEYAKQTANSFVQQFPDMQYSLISNDNSGEVILDFFYPLATREGYLEFDAFKYFSDPSGSQVICIHYAKNIEDIGSSRSYDDVLNDIKNTRKEIVSALAQFNLFGK